MTLSTDILASPGTTYSCIEDKTYGTSVFGSCLSGSIIDRSSQLNELFAAMAKVQGELRHAKKDSDNPFFKSKYSDLAEVIDTGRSVASKHGISVLQFPEGRSSLVTILAHSSGQFIMSRMEMTPVAKVKNKDGTTEIVEDYSPQAIGSCITYARRYAYSAVLGIASELDDDGNAASGNKTEGSTSTWNNKKPYQRGGSSPLKTFNRD